MYACVGPMDPKQPVAMLPVSPEQNVTDWLLPTGRLHYHIKGLDEQWTFMPLYDVPDSAVFTTFPVFGGGARERVRADSSTTPTCLATRCSASCPSTPACARHS